MATEHERIEKNTKSIGIVSRRLDQIEQLLGGEFKPQPAFAARPTYSFVFGATPFELGGAVAATAAGIWVSFKRCEKFYKNTTQHSEKVTITIRNNALVDTMTVDIVNIDGAMDGIDNSEIEAGHTDTIILDLPAGKSLHADQDGERLL